MYATPHYTHTACTHRYADFKDFKPSALLEETAQPKADRAKSGKKYVHMGLKVAK